MSDPIEETITIPKKEYEELKRSQFKLICLENGGVDNWEWYGDSLRNGGFFKEEEE